MNSEDLIREALYDLADDVPPVTGLAASALHRARRKRRLTRAAVGATAVLGAAAVAAAALPLGLGPAVGSDTGDSAATQAAPPAATQAAPPATPRAAPSAASGPEVLAAPAASELSGDALAAAFGACVAGQPGHEGWEPLLGVTPEADRQMTWLVSRRGDDYRADCTLDASGQVVAAGGEYGAKSTPALLYALVDGQEGTGVGRYVEPVVQVTVQYGDEPEQAAILRAGFWFYPIDEMRYFHENADEGDGWQELETMLDDHDLIGVPAGYTFRGYDADGQLVYDSSQDGPSVKDCYADPTGSEFVGNWAGRTDPSECVRTHEWVPLD